ncbi:MAG: hypothetical protein HY670_06375 [Chloroflexi bacterium]|nr:hypothetical protein [Chloroflexota bacterium]
MVLNLRSFRVEDVRFGAETAFAGGILTINKKELQARLLAGSDAVESVDVALAKPGDRTRIIRILDAVEPRTKLEKDASPFPGFIGPPYQAGRGHTVRLANTAIITTASFPEYMPDSHMGTNECIVDMSGPGVPFSPFSSIFNIVLSFERSKAATTVGFASAIRMASLETARYLAECAREGAPDEETSYRLGDGVPRSGLPKVAAVLLLSSLGTLSLPLREFFVYAHSVDGMLPILVHPNEVLDGAVVAAYYVYGAIRNPTYFYQNNPILHELYREHGKTLDFVGAILSRAGDTTDAGKLNKAARIAGLANLLRLDGAIVSSNAGGHHVVDFMLACQQLEKAGVKSAGIISEMAGADGSDNPFPMAVPEANSMVSTGNVEQKIVLPAVDTVLGGEKLQDGRVAAAQVEIPFRHIFCSMSQTGSWNIAARAF